MKYYINYCPISYLLFLTPTLLQHTGLLDFHVWIFDRPNLQDFNVC